MKNKQPNQNPVTPEHSPNIYKSPTFREQTQAHPPKEEQSQLSIPGLEPSHDGISGFDPICNSTEKDGSRVPHPISEGSSIITSNDSEQMSLDHLSALKERLALLWLDVLLIFQIGNLGSQSGHFPYLTWTCRFLISLQGIILVFHIGFIIGCHFKKYRHLLWVPLLFYEFQYLLMDINYTLPATIGTSDDAPEATVDFMKFVGKSKDSMAVIVLFQNTLITMFYLDSLQHRKYLSYLVFGLILILQTANFRSLNFAESYANMKITLMTITVVMTLVINFIFIRCIATLQAIQRMLFKLEIEENRKFKYMFNALQEGVILLQPAEDELAIKFVNSIALKIFDQAVEESGADSSIGLVHQPLFFTFQSSEEGQKMHDCGHALAVSDILAFDPHLIGHTTFTTSKAISLCTRMDQVQKIIEKEENGRQPKFFSIKVFKVKSPRSSAIRQTIPEEIMIQISDISVRVQSQYMKLERQYLSLMNSTVSHEMRNPLNAMVSQIAQQEQMLSELSAQIDWLEASPIEKSMRDILKRCLSSLEISRCSTKMLKFNVEDILALPQLKQGKFTKHFSQVDLPKIVNEVIQIMDFQAKEKAIEVTVEYEGFLKDPAGRMLINMDEQRFQQIVLNYLSNGLKFTELNGSILVLLQYVPPINIEGLPCQYRIWSRRTQQFWEKGEDPSEMSFSSASASEKSSSDQGSRLSQEQISRFIHLQRQTTESIFAPELSPKLVVTVADTGVGIKVEEQTRLFKLFGTIKRTRAINTRGVGLGLSISKMICEEFGGSVSLKSQEGKGSAFIGSFMLDKDECSLASRRCTQTSLQKRVERARLGQRIAAKVTSTEIRCGGPSSQDSLIFIVDDEAYNCEVLKAMITQLGIPNIGARLKVFLSGTEALRSLYQTLDEEKEEVRVVLTDLSMPILDGYQLVSKIRKEHNKRSRQQPMIAALTGHTETEFISKAYKKGADHVYSKPISLEQIQLVLLEAGIHLKIGQTES